MRRVRRWLTVALALAMVGAAGGGWWIADRIATPHGAFGEDGTFVAVPEGAALATIGRRLAEAGVVPDALTFRLAAEVEGATRRLQAGEYRFAGGETPRDVVRRIAAGDVYTRPVTFPEGLTIRQLADVFEQAGLGARADFVAAATDASLIAHLDSEAADLEGYLFPDTYPLPRHVTAAEVVRAMVAGFERVFDADLRAASAARGMTVREVATLAAIIEKETAAADEHPIVSAVYHNRLRIGMPLQADPTVVYAMMRAGTWSGNIRRQDLQLDSPYNTYRHGGLPPGPIAAPGRAALVAALNPADVKYLYFVSRNDGTHVFATTLVEHNRNVARWQLRRGSGS